VLASLRADDGRVASLLATVMIVPSLRSVIGCEPPW
jgi:hypothetical protein